MLGNVDAAPNLAVKDLARAEAFYEGVLGLTRQGGFEGHLTSYRSGATSVNVYVSEHAGTNQATAVTWEVEDIQDVVRALRAKGVRFERYDMPGMRLEDDVYVSDEGGMHVAWFKDPDGNILNLASG